MKKIIPLLAAGFLVISLTSIRAQSNNPAAKTKTAEDLSQFKTASDLWAHVQKLSKGLKRDSSDKLQFETVAEAHNYFLGIDTALKAFLKRFPNDPHKWEARLLAAEINGPLRQTGKPPTQWTEEDLGGNNVMAVSKEIIAAPDAPAGVKHEARFNVLMFTVFVTATTNIESAQNEMAAYQQDYPDDPRAGDLGDFLKMTLAKKLQNSDPARAEAMLAELGNSANPQTATQAKALLRTKSLLNKPLDLKFMAIDGSEVDLGTFRGKVVLIDFWATWCAPCMQEVPGIVAAYKKYHAKGLEILGISLDEDRMAVLRATKANDMTWPQYFDGKGWTNKIGSSWGINEIPQLWLVDKKGNLVNTSARGNLDAAIEKLLAE